MSSADAVIKWIEDNYLGKGEPFPPKGGNWIPFQESWGYPANVVVEWCGGLLMEAIKQTGGTIAPDGTAPNTWYTVTGAQQFMRRGDWIPADGKTPPQRGWFIFFDWGGGGWINNGDLGACARIDHVGIITDGSKWNASTNWLIETIEGNIDQRCGRFRRFDNPTVVGFGRPRYVTAPPPPPVVVPSIPQGGQGEASASAIVQAEGRPLVLDVGGVPVDLAGGDLIAATPHPAEHVLTPGAFDRWWNKANTPTAILDELRGLRRDVQALTEALRGQ